MRDHAYVMLDVLHCMMRGARPCTPGASRLPQRARTALGSRPTPGVRLAHASCPRCAPQARAGMPPRPHCPSPCGTADAQGGDGAGVQRNTADAAADHSGHGGEHDDKVRAWHTRTPRARGSAPHDTRR